MNWAELSNTDAPHLAIRYALFVAWMGTGAVCYRVSRLRYERAHVPNLLSLFLGPVGWTIHLISLSEPEHVADIDPQKAVMPGQEGADVPLMITRPKAEPKTWLGRMIAKLRRDPVNEQNEDAQRLLVEAFQLNASDIHLEPHAGGYAARYRINGLLREHRTFPAQRGEHIAGVFKVRASLNSADRTKMQDSRFSWMDPSTQHVLDVRISCSPTLHGEKVALRLLNRPASLLRLQTVGMTDNLRDTLKRSLRQPEGLVLVAGPTGAGKTSTAYALLQEVSGPSVNTMTIEDPVEYALPYATQIGINPKQGISFESGLRTLLRQDPNVIFVGEMRDLESFRIGVRAALSGHLVVSTMHARDAVAALTALRNLDLDKIALGSALRVIISQRLVRELCPHCRRLEPLNEEGRDFLGADVEGGKLFAPSTDGCMSCVEGFTGRTGVFEVLRVDRPIREWLCTNESESALRERLAEAGHRTMRDDARDKMLTGRVWIEDAIRALGVKEEV